MGIYPVGFGFDSANDFKHREKTFYTTARCGRLPFRQHINSFSSVISSLIRPLLYSSPQYKMRFAASILSSVLVTAVSAHFQLQYPPPRGVFVEDDEPTFCGTSLRYHSCLPILIYQINF